MNINKSSAWGMRAPRNRYSTHTPTSATIHNMGAQTALIKPDWTRADSIAALKSVERHHVINNGWNAIGYHLFIMPDGSIWQGRPLGAIGAHVGGNNTRRIGVLVYGSFDLEEPTTKQRIALHQLAEWLRVHHQITQIDTHGELAKTSCPGKHLQTAVEALRRGVSAVKALSKPEIVAEIRRLLDLL